MRNEIYKCDWQLNALHRQIAEDKFLFVSPSGEWSILDEEEFFQTQSIALKPPLYDKLEDRHLILTKENSTDALEYYKHWNKVKYRSPTLMIIETTKSCNLQCKYCHAAARPAHSDAPRTKTQMTPETANQIIDFAFSLPTDHLSFEFQGGESLLNFEIIKHFVRKVEEKCEQSNKCIDFSLVSNLIHLNDEHCKFIKQHNIKYCSSLDGPQFVHDGQRTTLSGEGSFDRFRQALRTLRDNDMHPPGVLTVLTKKSLPYYKEIIDMLDDLGLSTLCFIFINRLGFASKNWDELGVDSDEHVYYYKLIMDYIFEKWRNGKYLSERMFDLALDKLFKNSDVGFLDFRNPCGMVNGQLAFDVFGNIYTCDEARGKKEYKLGNVKDNSAEEILDSDQVKSLVSQSLLNYHECHLCAYRPYCVNCPIANNARKKEEEKDSNSCNQNIHCKFTQLIMDYIFDRIVNDSETMMSYLIYRKIRETGEV